MTPVAEHVTGWTLILVCALCLVCTVNCSGPTRPPTGLESRPGGDKASANATNRRRPPTIPDSERPLPDEVRLVNHLLARYDRMGKVARPKYNSSRLMMVQFGMRLIQMDIIEKEQVLKTSVWVRARWIDEYLRWDPREFGMIREIVLPWDKVWTPDIVLVNTASTDVDERHADIMVTYHGAVFWSPHRLFKSACLIDVTNFPFDRHTCHLWFQSMSRYSWQLNLEPYSKNPWDLQTYLASFKKSQEWEIIENITQRYERSQDVGVLLKFSRRVALRFTLTAQRRLGYTCHLLMLPCIFLGCMTLVVFCLPPERPDRHTLAVSAFASFMVLLLILIEVAPPSHASTPKLGMYYAANMSIVMLSIFLSGLVINISRRGDRKQIVPKPIEVVFIDILARALFIHGRVSKAFLRSVTRKPPNEALDAMEAGQKKKNNQIALQDGASNKASENLLSDKMKQIEETLVKAGDPAALDRDCDIRLLRIQWKNIGLVMDRFFFVTYFITLIITLIILFPRPDYPPQLFEQEPTPTGN